MSERMNLLSASLQGIVDCLENDLVTNQDLFQQYLSEQHKQSSRKALSHPDGILFGETIEMTICRTKQLHYRRHPI